MVAARVPYLDGLTAIDRRAVERADDTLLDGLLADPSTRVVELRHGTAPVHPIPDPVTGGEEPPERGAAGPTARRLVWRSPEEDDRARLVVFLGRDRISGAALLAAVEPEATGTSSVPPRAAAAAGTTGAAVTVGETETADVGVGVGDGADGADAERERIEWLGLREVGPALGELDVEAFMCALAMDRWHRVHPCCPRCGAALASAHGGWVRRCHQDGSEHYPRTDPAVIMAITDPEDRLLLARQPAWPYGRMSVLAGFCEPGERLEESVAREVAEEVGIVVREITYVGSQPWPFPASLMLGFTATTDDPTLRLDDEEIAEAKWVTRDSLSVELNAGRLGLPGRLSIARRLIEGWYGERLTPPLEWADIRR